MRRFRRLFEMFRAWPCALVPGVVVWSAARDECLRAAVRDSHPANNNLFFSVNGCTLLCPLMSDCFFYRRFLQLKPPSSSL